MTLWEMVAESAERYGKKAAILFRRDILSYADTYAFAQDIGKGLKGVGIGGGERVALMLPNSPEFILAYFAILASGAIVVPVNILFTAAELSFLLEDAEASLILTSRHLYPVLKEARRSSQQKIRAVLLDGEHADLVGEDLSLEDLLRSKAGSVPGPADPEDVAACLYTSGTTGRPKGALLTHRNLLSNVEAFGQVTPCDERDTFLSVLPLFHSYGATVSMLFPLRIGATVVLEPRFVPDQLLSSIATYNVTLFAGVPPMYAIWARMPAPRLDFSSWRFCISGGAPLPPGVLERFEAKYPVRVYEGYGTTECSPVLTQNPVGGRRKAGSVGLPIPGVELRVVDEAGGEVPRGGVGEVIVRGPNLMRGYWRRPEATAEVFKEGWFHTGDLGRMDEEGYLYLVDRKKDLIIVGGLNVYPREVEEVLLAHPKVAEAAVIGVSHPIKGEEPKAVVVLKEGEAWTAREVREHCRRYLAAFKVPRQVEFKVALPRTATGKVAKQLLKQEADV